MHWGEWIEGTELHCIGRKRGNNSMCGYMLIRIMDRYRSKQVYVSPSDTIMSPCTAKLSAYKSKQFGK